MLASEILRRQELGVMGQQVIECGTLKHGGGGGIFLHLLGIGFVHLRFPLVSVEIPAA